MARFYGRVGFGTQVEKVPGTWVNQITSRNYYGEILRNTRQTVNGDKVNNDVTVNNSISIVSDDVLSQNVHAIVFVEWSGVLWTVSSVEKLEGPRLLLSIGSVYNGPKA